MSVVAPVSSLAAVAPVVAGAARGQLPSPGVAGGLPVALAGGLIIALEPGASDASGGRVAPGAILAAASALGFGLFFVTIDHAAHHGGVAWAVSVNRATSLTALVLAIAVGRRGVACCAGDLRAAGIVGSSTRAPTRCSRWRSPRAWRAPSR